MFLNLLTARITSHDDEPAEFQIDDTYSVPVCIICVFFIFHTHARHGYLKLKILGRRYSGVWYNFERYHKIK